MTRLHRFCLVEKISISFVANGLLDNMCNSVVFDHAIVYHNLNDNKLEMSGWDNVFSFDSKVIWTFVNC